jgi:hypothetical protein
LLILTNKTLQRKERETIVLLRKKGNTQVECCVYDLEGRKHKKQNKTTNHNLTKVICASKIFFFYLPVSYVALNFYENLILPFYPFTNGIQIVHG